VIELRVNGESTRVAEGATLVDLLGHLGLDHRQQGIAVAVNLEVVPRSHWPDHHLTTGDDVEIIHAVQGG
jgi:sulfur carrier protein